MESSNILTTFLLNVVDELVEHLGELGSQEVEFLTEGVVILQPTLHIITVTTLTFPTILLVIEVDSSIVGFVTQDLIELVGSESHLVFVHETKILHDVGHVGV
jgi:hypothetical protein